jgi:DNA-binding transcriptional ArsR family regulator
MSRKNRKRARARGPGREMGQAVVFSAMGDKTRLALIARLARGQPESSAHRTRGSRLTRQAVTKHLRVLEQAGLVRSVRCGRESLFALDPRPLTNMEAYLSRVSREWAGALERLKAFVEE